MPQQNTLELVQTAIQELALLDWNFKVIPLVIQNLENIPGKEQDTVLVILEMFESLYRFHTDELRLTLKLLQDNLTDCKQKSLQHNNITVQS
jgi:hypothetical protein